MKLRTWSAACAAVTLGLAAGLMAQTSTPAQPPSTASKTITVTGCVQRASGTTGTTGTAGTATAGTATAGMSGGFILANATMGTGSTSTSTAGGTTTPPSTATSGTSMSAGTQYRLDVDDAKLAPHVGHKVEISGTLADQMSTGTSTSGTTTPPSTAGATTGSMSAATAPKLKVDTVRMISATCP